MSKQEKQNNNNQQRQRSQTGRQQRPMNINSGSAQRPPGFGQPPVSAPPQFETESETPSQRQQSWSWQGNEDSELRNAFSSQMSFSRPETKQNRGAIGPPGMSASSSSFGQPGQRRAASFSSQQPYRPESAHALEGVQFLWEAKNISEQNKMRPYSMFSGIPALNIRPDQPRSPVTAGISRIPSAPAPAAMSQESAETAIVRYVPPQRPAPGVKGRSTRVRANFFEFLSAPGKQGESVVHIAHYDIKITPEVPPSLNRRIFREMVASGKIGRQASPADEMPPPMVYDGRRNLYTPVTLAVNADPVDPEHYPELKPDADAMALEITITDKVSESNQLFNSRRFLVQLKVLDTIDMKRLHEFLNSPRPVAHPPQDVLTALDVIMRHRPSMLLTSVGRSFFSPNDSKLLGDGAVCWMGFHQSVRPAKGRLLMNIDVSATAFYEPGTVLNFLARNLGKKSADDFRSALRPREADKAERLLKDIKVSINHRGDVRRKYKIIGLTRTSADQTFFKYNRMSEDGKNVGDEVEMSVEAYFARQYQHPLKYPFLPCLKVGNPQKSVYLPMEVCDIVAGQRFLRKLNEQQTAQMIRLTCQTPDRRANKIAEAVSELGLNPSNTLDSSKEHDPDRDYLAGFGVRISDEMVTVPARVLDAPTIEYHQSSREPFITPRDGSWNLRDKKVLQPATLHSWAMVCFGTSKEMPLNKIAPFLRELVSTCRDTGLNITNHEPPIIYADPSSIENTLQKAWYAAGEAVQTVPQLIVCILPNTGVPLYAEIKRVGDTVLGIPTQCVQVRHTAQPKKQYCANVCLKINTKLGGVNSIISKNPNSVHDEGLPWVSEVPTMIFGADITHPAHGENKTQGSVCALVGSLDRAASRYSACTRLQPPRKDVIVNLADMVFELITLFHAENENQLPLRILFYRDGINEMQFYNATVFEVEAIREACQKFKPGFCPDITYVAVQKRHHARVFVTNPRDADRSGNVPAGTVIDSHITHPSEYDFYLCSHSGLQGTSRPTHYHILYDENNLSADTIQEFTYRLCYGYARCTRSVSVVPPAYYADLVAFRAKYHLKSAMSRDPVSPIISDSRTDSSDGQENMAKDERSSSRGRNRRSESLTPEEEVELMKKLESKLAKVKPDLQKVMYFM